MKNKLVLGYFTLLVFVLAVFGVSALEEDNYCVEVQITDINPSSVELENEVTVGIQFDNCGSKLPEVVSFEIKRFSEDIIIREPLIIEFDEPFGYSNSQRFNVYHLYVTKDATPGEYVFEYEISYGNRDFQISKEEDFSITVTSQKSDLNIAYVKTEPILPKVGDEVTLTIRLENFGAGDANSVKSKIDLPFFGVKESFLGQLEAGDDSSAVFTIIPDKEGVISYDLLVNYNDDFGEHEFTETLELNIQEDATKSNVLSVVLIVLVLIGAITVYYFKFRNSEKKESKIKKRTIKKRED